MKKLMAQEETMVPNLFYNLKRALTPLMHDDTYAAMANVTALIEKANFQPKNRVSGKAASNKRPGEEIVAGAASPVVETKRTKVVALEGEEEAAADDGLMEEDDEAGDTAEANQTCGQNGGYCPPCYELA
jgi:hypothetical protein